VNARVSIMAHPQIQIMKSIFFFDTALGKIAIAEDGQAVTRLFLPGEVPPADASLQKTDLLCEAKEQLDSYLLGGRKAFDLPLDLSGTEFMRAVWQALLAIPYGETRSYKDVAESLNRPRAFRAVGAACRANPLPVFIPCHRVIGRDGSLSGYRGGLQIKRHLLELEGCGRR